MTAPGTTAPGRAPDWLCAKAARLTGALAAAALLWMTAAAPTHADDCQDPAVQPGIEAICGVVAPEDIVRLGERTLIISTFEPADYLYGFDLASQTLSRLDTRLSMPAADQRWGDKSCVPPTSMVSHGLDLSQRADGELQLLVVNHGERESIEYFSIAGDSTFPTLQWRGCVPAADNTQFNDVAGLPDGGFLASDPITASWQLPRMLLGALGMNTGQVYRWSPGAGYRTVPNTEGAYPNGILLSASGDSFYLNLYLDGEVREHALADGAVLNRVAIAKPDNSSLSPDGKLLVASHDASVFALLAAVMDAPAERNTIPFEIVAVDTGSFKASLRFRSDGQALGGGTIAEAVGDDLYIGAFRGDRIIRVSAAAP